MGSTGIYITNINSAFKNIKLSIFADYVQRDSTGCYKLKILELVKRMNLVLG